jgi:signal transduction histidine kinase
LDCERLYVFPNQALRAGLLVGASNLDKPFLGLFRVLTLGIPEDRWGNFSGEAESLYTAIEIREEVSYNFQETLAQVLVTVAASFACQAAYIAIRQGELFRVEASWQCDPQIHGLQVSMEDNPVLEKLATTARPRLLKRPSLAGDLIPEQVFDGKVRAWMGIPLVVGTRVIGLLGFITFRKTAFSEHDLRRAELLARQVAPVVENSIAFAEARRHLQRLALLNELASAASAGLEIEKVAGRVLRMLRRTFHTDLITLLVLASDGKSLMEFGEDDGDPGALILPVSKNLPRKVMASGMPLRVGDAKSKPRYTAIHPSARSGLAVPLKYRGKIIGLLNLESTEPNAFSMEDEQLLVVICSHLAGLIENVRLSEETRERARNIERIHQVVQRVVGLTDLDHIARLSAEMMAEIFGYDFASVRVSDVREPVMETSGVGGSLVAQLASGVNEPAAVITESVMNSGNSYLSQDLSKDAYYRPLPDWQAGSLMCVPLREGDWVFGAISAERTGSSSFSENDLLVLESLAGFLSSVMMNARRYRQLQKNVRHMQAARETALDISADLGVETLLSRVVHRVKELVVVKGVELGLVDEAGQNLHVLVSDSPWRRASGRAIPLMSDVAGRVAALGEPLVVNNYQEWKGRLNPVADAPITSVAGVPLKYKGEVIGALTVFDDQPERVFQAEDLQLLELLAPQVAVSIRNARLYQELQERIEAQQLAENRLVQSARLAAVGEMAAGVAHELNNPLTTVTGFAELILEELPEIFPQRPDVELILKESKRARGVVRRLLDFSRQSESVRERADLNEVVVDVMALVRHLARTGGVETQLELAEELPLVYIDRNHMKQVLLNLVHNALQAMPTGGDLRVVTASQEKAGEPWVTMAVHDTGEGIPPENLGKIFEPFFTTKPTGSGTGLGLSISYGIVSDHGGYIEVESEPGAGSWFRIWLPLEGDAVDA